MGKPIVKGQLCPLSIADFINWLEKSKRFDSVASYQDQIFKLAERLERNGVLTGIGGVYVAKKYLFVPILTNQQKASPTWIAAKVGSRHMFEIVRQQVMAIVGVDSEGDPSIGSGLMVSDKLVLTCEHVISDMSLTHVEDYAGKRFEVANSYSDPTIDVGIIELKDEGPQSIAIPFRTPNLLDEVLTIGYPPVPMSATNIQVVQKGEVVTEHVRTYDKRDVFLFSAIARPGNSGGPVLSLDGTVCGIVTRELNDEEGLNSAYYAGVPADAVSQAISNMDIGFQLPVENFD